ncbi:MAG: response regulator transcription factor [Bacteroidetes bacterium]|nr:response regulator transcription factor [Bacteroidota bacterium]
MKQTIIIFGSLSIAILLLFQLSKLSLMSYQDSNDVYIIIAGCLFISIGFLINRFIYKKAGKEKHRIPYKVLLNETNLSKQEYKVLNLMADGFSNNGIAASLFISESTVKTHVSKILVKLNAKRRTEAIKIGRDLNII